MEIPNELLSKIEEALWEANMIVNTNKPFYLENENFYNLLIEIKVLRLKSEDHLS
jgi:hypothetical protein